MAEPKDLPVPLGGSGSGGGSAVPALPGRAGRRKVLVFQAAGEWFALPLDRVREACPRAPVTRVPRAPAQVAGVMNLRGRVVTLVDLARCLGLPDATGAGDHVVVLALSDPELAVGLLADRIDQVVDVGEEDPEVPSAPEGAGLLEVSGRAVTLLDPAQVLGRALPGVEAEGTGEGA